MSECPDNPSLPRRLGGMTIDGSMRDLLNDPLWRAEDVGAPLPDSPHACSVCLPTWASVIGYEENDPRVTGRMRAGYPRFFCHPTVRKLTELAVPTEAGDRRALVFPTAGAAELAAEFVRRTHPDGVEVAPFGERPVWLVVFAASAERRARLFWRYCGQGVSSRLAEACLEGWPSARFAAEEAAGGRAREIVRSRLAELSGQPKANVFLFGSGMAGIYAVCRALEKIFPGRKTVQLGFPYVDALKVQEEFGSGVLFLPGVGDAEIERLATALAGEPFSAVFTEIPSNPLLECADLAALSEITHRAQLPLIADDTVATVVNADVLRFADVATASLTKAFSGVGDVMGGSVIISGRSRWANAFRARLAVEEAIAPIFSADAVVLEKNSRDFPERVHRMNRSASELVAWVRQHPKVARVYFPSIDSPAAYAAVRRPGGGDGMLFSFTLRDPAASARVFDALRVCKGPSLGTNYTLACPFTLLAHYTELDWAESCGVSRHLIRVSVGLEEPSELRERFRKALDIG